MRPTSTHPPRNAAVPQRRRTARRGLVVSVVLAMVALLSPPFLQTAGATDGLDPSGTIQNIPDSGDCGDNGERWVKFTTGGPVLASGQANSGNPKWKANYTSSPGHFTVSTVTDEFGNLVSFNAIAGGAQSANPVWTFASTTSSPLLNVPNDGNFSQFAICALPPLVKATITKTVTGGSATGVSFTITVDCRLGDRTVNLATPTSVTVSAGGSAEITAPTGASCTVSEPTVPVGFELVSITPSSFTMPEPSTDNPNPNVAVAVVNKVAVRDLVISKKAVGGAGTFTFSVTCTDASGATVFSRTGVTVTVATAGATNTTTLEVPATSTCTATETNLPTGFTLDGATGPRAESSGTVSFTNTARGNLEIKKVQTGGLSSTEFTIEYSCTDGTTGSVTIKGGETATVDDIVSGSTCTVTEDAPLYTVAISGPATIPVGGTATITVTNTRKTTDLTINKTAVGGTGTFTFSVSCSGTDGTFGPTTASITVSTAGATNSTTVTGIPTGLSCTVTETDPGDTWAVSPATRTATATAGGSVSFTNTKKQPLTIVKFYDTNRNGTQDNGEPGIVGWQFRVAGTTATTGAGGSVTIQVVPGSYTVTEGGATGWLATTATSASVNVSSATTVRFGNICLGAGGGRTIGFWGNRNGNALIDAADLAMLRALPLVNGSGAAFDPTTLSQWNTWLQGANATNMAYMLSAQLAAMKLNVANGLVSGAALVYAPGVVGADSLGFISVSALLAQAETALAADGLTLSGDPNRAYQDVLKTAIDNANNNRTFFQTTPCPAPTSFTF